MSIEQQTIEEQMLAVIQFEVTPITIAGHFAGVVGIEESAAACVALHEEYTKPLRDEIDRLKGELVKVTAEKKENFRCYTQMADARLELRSECEKLEAERDRLKDGLEKLKKHMEIVHRPETLTMSTTYWLINNALNPTPPTS